MKSWKDDPRADTNPLFNDNPLKLGLFGLNGIGISMTNVPEAPNARWSESVAVSKIADEAGFEANVPYARWRGFIEEEPSHRSGLAMDCYTWAAATSQLTSRGGVFSTSHVPTIHPIAAAKQCATIDLISGGRFGLNVVAGWNKPELDMFGAPMKEHDDRYAQAAEWIEVIRQLWTREEAFDFEGQYYAIKKGISLPKPMQKPFPPIMNAGGSDRGRAFAAKYADMAFVIVKSDDPDEIRREADLYRRTAREEHGRDIQIWTYAYVVQRETEQEARDYLNYYAVEHGDDRALDGWMRLQGMHTQLMPKDVMEAMRFRFKAGNGGFELVGTADQITSRLELLKQGGIDGVLLGWVGFEDGIQRWVKDVMPRMTQAGLRLG
ncbi:luciferase family protein [Rhizorhabdus wittichii RW1]|uniref:Luciferase family protein n=2 Tax=Rhizorhabdus wittichii TaxID=160791 RepID=A0A9J9HFG9_RHIWR|nr:LLM class flavin-dependent oxidoreductase [Rhizorhabdus wittichii]ABQ70612.1 luciferase family protein [Rhizorhabdus wittichii RW1]QTH23873.1 LLM class flavin-dependent oxidoreductase [Rhizorhabdus wittichii]